MPASYRHLRIRLHLKQARLLRWGEKVGLLHEELVEPIEALRLNHELVLDILLEMQNLFKETMQIQEDYNDAALGESSCITDSRLEGPFVHALSSDTVTLLQNASRFLNRTPKKLIRLKWAMVKQDQLEGMIQKLIGYNEAIEALLHKTEIRQLRDIQQQASMSMLHLNCKMEELKQISLAIQVQTNTPPQYPLLSDVSSLQEAKRREENEGFTRLADFKANEILLGISLMKDISIERNLIVLESQGYDRSEAIYRGEAVWIEWRDISGDYNATPEWDRAIKDRAKKLAGLL